MVNGVWQPAKRYESKLLDSIGLKCRLNVVTRDGLILGVVSVHDFGKSHTMLFVHYDAASKEWMGPIVEAPSRTAPSPRSRPPPCGARFSTHGRDSSGSCASVS
jgi:hypothetical protein